MFFEAPALRRHAPTLVLTTAVSAALATWAIRTDRRIDVLIHGAVVLAAFTITRAIPSGAPLGAIAHPRRESAMVLGSYAAAFALTAYRFLAKPDMAAMGVLPKFVLLVLVASFVYALAPLAYFAWTRRYPLAELGWRRDGWLAGVMVVAIFGATAILFRPSGLQFQSIVDNEGWGAFITLGLLTAALPEETMRFYAQTRLEAWLGSRQAAWIITAVVWAMMHLPLFYRNAGALLPSVMQVIALIPLGLLWGYMTRRYSSILPAVIVHATNLWGLQNVFP